MPCRPRVDRLGPEHHHAGSDISPPARFAFARRGSGPASLQVQVKADDQDSRGKGGEPPQLRDRSREARFEKAHLRAEDQTDMTPEEMFAVDHTRTRISVRMRSLRPSDASRPPQRPDSQMAEAFPAEFIATGLRRLSQQGSGRGPWVECDGDGDIPDGEETRAAPSHAARQTRRKHDGSKAADRAMTISDAQRDNNPRTYLVLSASPARAPACYRSPLHDRRTAPILQPRAIPPAATPLS